QIAYRHLYFILRICRRKLPAEVRSRIVRLIERAVENRPRQTVEVTSYYLSELRFAQAMLLYLKSTRGLKERSLKNDFRYLKSLLPGLLRERLRKIPGARSLVRMIR